MQKEGVFIMAAKLNLNPETIYSKTFNVDFKGYNPEEVDKMLDLVIKDYQTYEKSIAELQNKMKELERTNASLRAKLIEVEGQARASKDADPMLKGANNVDVLKRLSRLEEEVFGSNNR